MSVRYFCDGCGQEISDDRQISVSVENIQEISERIRMAVRPPGYSPLPKIESYHLCTMCEHRLRDAANPTKWPRASS